MSILKDKPDIDVILNTDMKLELTNFMSYSNYQIVFPDNNFTLLKGDTGIGKSTLLHAVQWCLFGGRDDVYTKGVQGSHNHQTKVVLHLTELKMADSDDCIIITRTKPPDNVHIFIPGYGALEGTQAQSYIARIFGTKNVWLASSYLKQEERCPLISLSLSNADKFGLLQEITFGCEVTCDSNSKDNPVWYLAKCDAACVDKKNKTRTLTDQYNGMLTMYNRQYEIGRPALTVWGGCPTLSAVQQIESDIEVIEAKIVTLNQHLMEIKAQQGANHSVSVSLESYKVRLTAATAKQSQLSIQIGNDMDIMDPNLPQRLNSTAEFVKLTARIDKLKSDLQQNGTIDPEIAKLSLEQCHQELALYQQHITIGMQEHNWCQQRRPPIQYNSQSLTDLVNHYQHVLSINDTIKASHDTYNQYQQQLIQYKADRHRRNTLQCQQQQLMTILNSHVESKPVNMNIITDSTAASHKVTLQRAIHDKSVCEGNGIPYMITDIGNAITLIDDNIRIFNTLALKEAEYHQYLIAKRDYDTYQQQKTQSYETLQTSLRGYQALEDKLALFCSKEEKAASWFQYNCESTRNYTEIDAQIASAKGILQFNLQCPHCQGHLSYDTNTNSLKGVKTTANDIIAANKDIARLTNLKVILGQRDTAKLQSETLSNHYNQRYPSIQIRDEPVPILAPETSSFTKVQIHEFTTALSHLKSIQWVDIKHMETQINEYTLVTAWNVEYNRLSSELRFINETLNNLGPQISEPVVVSPPTDTVLNQHQCQDYHQVIAVTEKFQFPNISVATSKVTAITLHIKCTQTIADIDNLQRQFVNIINEIPALTGLTYTQLELLSRQVKACQDETTLVASEITKLTARLIPMIPTDDIEMELINLQAEIRSLRTKYDGGKYLITLTDSYETLKQIGVQISTSVEEESDLITLRNMINDISTKALQDTVDCINIMTNDVLQHLFLTPINFELKLFKELKTRDQVKSQINLSINHKGNIYESIEGLSGGEKDRISLGLTIALNKICGSPLIFLDECMAQLNAEMRQKCSKCVYLASGGKTIVNVCHEISEGYNSNTIKIQDT
jgi:ABC-type lipoprotein export system ATPase subunit